MRLFPFYSLLPFLPLFTYVASDNVNSYKILCPATSLIDFKVDGLYRYPLDLFDPSAIKKSSSQNNKYYNCSSKRITNREHISYHVCSGNSLHTTQCPLIPESAKDALTMSTWMNEWDANTKPHLKQKRHTPFLLTTWKLLMNPRETVRLFIFGGSSALGAETEGSIGNF